MYLGAISKTYNHLEIAKKRHLNLKINKTNKYIVLTYK